MIPKPVSPLGGSSFFRAEDGLNGLTSYFELQKTEARVVKPRVSRTKGHLSKRTQFVREIVKEVSGYVAILMRCEEGREWSENGDEDVG